MKQQMLDVSNKQRMLEKLSWPGSICGDGDLCLHQNCHRPETSTLLFLLWILPTKPSKRLTKLTTSKQLRSETESKTSSNTSVQSSRQKSLQITSEQLFIKPTTPGLKRRDSFGSRKFAEDSSESGTLLRSSKSVPNLSDSPNLFTTPKSPLPATPSQRPASTHTPRQRLSHCVTFQRGTPKPLAASQNSSLKKSYKEESKGSDMGSSMEECIGKTKGARVVPSRFREAAALKKKVVNKGPEKSSELVLKRLNVKKKCMDLHSTGLEESALMPSLNWDLSAMKPELSAIEMPECTNSILEPVLSPTLSEDDAVEVHNFDALLFSYLASKRENNLEKYQERAEECLLQIEEENQHLRKEIFQQKQDLLLLEKSKQLDGMIEQQVEHLRPVVASIQLFKTQYKSFGQALDTTRHSLQTKNIYMSEDLRMFLEELKIHLRTTCQVLGKRGFGLDRKNSKAGIELGKAAAKTDTEMKSFFAKIEELASCISRETTLLHQELDEEALGMKVSAKGIFI
ncbi:HAUS augmin-like complex subunit 8 isoform X2 [Stegostoma tigrinum]|uniref:HAUS augmin-like complex subunit 8 isoform X2 n=1 Tax=Stegostoma tigrinum TaxID=3053191 RepID=UPI00286FAFA9|nr:HAUS augmin-like complex subunit 8 isoform X2 [Stegostoma tigrinum]